MLHFLPLFRAPNPSPLHLAARNMQRIVSVLVPHPLLPQIAASQKMKKSIRAIKCAASTLHSPSPRSLCYFIHPPPQRLLGQPHPSSCPAAKRPTLLISTTVVLYLQPGLLAMHPKLTSSTPPISVDTFR
jgi:hypothetical protein